MVLFVDFVNKFGYNFYIYNFNVLVSCKGVEIVKCCFV